MILKRPSGERGHANHGWLDTYHTFSFASYQDADHMGWGPLRVLNDDRVAPAAGFGEHPHHDMEIITYVTHGALEHRDSMGNGSVIRPGDVQRMSAGTGVTHSEFNHSDSEEVRFHQIWIFPDQRGITPEYDQQHVERNSKLNRAALIASGDGREGSMKIHQDADMYASILETGKEVSFSLAAGRKGWVHMLRGEAELNGEVLRGGDGAAIADEESIKLKGVQEAEFFFFDLPDFP